MLKAGGWLSMLRSFDFILEIYGVLRTNENASNEFRFQSSRFYRKLRMFCSLGKLFNTHDIEHKRRDALYLFVWYGAWGSWIRFYSSVIEFGGWNGKNYIQSMCNSRHAQSTSKCAAATVWSDSWNHMFWNRTQDKRMHFHCMETERMTENHRTASLPIDINQNISSHFQMIFIFFVRAQSHLATDE